MNVYERQAGPTKKNLMSPINAIGLDRSSMDLETPHGNAQARLDEMFDTAAKYKTVVQYGAAGESTEAFHPSSPAKETVLFDVLKITPTDNSTTDSLKKETATKKPKKPSKTHDTTGLNGFYKGTFYRNGTAEKPKKKKGK